MSIPSLPTPTLFPYTTLFRSRAAVVRRDVTGDAHVAGYRIDFHLGEMSREAFAVHFLGEARIGRGTADQIAGPRDRKSTRLNSSHPSISYAVFCLKEKKAQNT